MRYYDVNSAYIKLATEFSRKAPSLLSPHNYNLATLRIMYQIIAVLKLIVRVNHFKFKTLTPVPKVD